MMDTSRRNADPAAKRETLNVHLTVTEAKLLRELMDTYDVTIADMIGMSLRRFKASEENHRLAQKFRRCQTCGRETR